MFENLKKLADKLEGETKSELLAEIEKFEEKELIANPKSLDEVYKSEEYADLKKLLNAREGQLRTKWESENKKEPEIADPDSKGNNLENEFKAELEKLKNEFLSLKGESEKQKFTNYAKEQLKDLPEKTLNLIHVTENSTQEEIDNQISAAKEVYAEAQKKIDNRPKVGQGVEVTDSEFDEVLSQIKEESNLPTKS